MQIKPKQVVTPGQRVVPELPSSDGSTRIVLLFAGVIPALLGVAFSDRATGAFYALEDVFGLAPSQQQFAATYRQLEFLSCHRVCSARIVWLTA